MRHWKTAAQTWQPPDDWLRVTTIDAHTAGEPLRIYIDGFPEPAGLGDEHAATRVPTRCRPKTHYHPGYHPPHWKL